MRERIDPFEQMDRMLEQMRHGLWTGYGGPDTPRFGSRRLGESTEADGELVSDEYSSGGHALTLDRTDDGLVVLADLPGFEKAEIELTFKDGVLSISGTREVTDDHSARSRTVHESVRIHSDVVASEITASYRNGVLEVTLPVEDDEGNDYRIDIE
jgi:HSP20 family protein